MLEWGRIVKSPMTGYEVSSLGDRNFSALYAKLKNGKTIEEVYQLDIKGYRGKVKHWLDARGKSPIRKISAERIYKEYKGLWEQYLNENPYLRSELFRVADGKMLTDFFAKTDISHAMVLSEILNEQSTIKIYESMNIEMPIFKELKKRIISQGQKTGKFSTLWYGDSHYDYLNKRHPIKVIPDDIGTIIKGIYNVTNDKHQKFNSVLINFFPKGTESRTHIDSNDILKDDFGVMSTMAMLSLGGSTEIIIMKEDGTISQNNMIKDNMLYIMPRGFQELVRYRIGPSNKERILFTFIKLNIPNKYTRRPKTIKDITETGLK